MQLKPRYKHSPFQKASLPRYLTQEELKRLFSVIAPPTKMPTLAMNSKGNSRVCLGNCCNHSGIDYISSPRDRALFALIYHYGLRVEEATLLTLESVDLKNLHIRIQRLKDGVSSQKPLWRHNAKLLRSYLRVRQDADTGSSPADRDH